MTFGWYPTGLNSGHELAGNYLRAVDTFPDMLRPELARLPRIVYEFDSPDLRTGTMYPAMARTFRAVGTQFASMFAYDMLRHRLAQPRLADPLPEPGLHAAQGDERHHRRRSDAPAAADALVRAVSRRTPGSATSTSPPTTTWASWWRGTRSCTPARRAPRRPTRRRCAASPGTARRPSCTYEGEGIYFLDKVRPGVWRLEVYPDAVPVRDPFEPPNPDKIVTRAISRSWPMTVDAARIWRRPSRCSRVDATGTRPAIAVAVGGWPVHRHARASTC